MVVEVFNVLKYTCTTHGTGEAGEEAGEEAGAALVVTEHPTGLSVEAPVAL